MDVFLNAAHPWHSPKYLDLLNILKSIALVHYVNSIMLIGAHEPEVACMLYTLSREWEINPRDILGATVLVKCLAIHWEGSTTLGSLFGFRR